MAITKTKTKRTTATPTRRRRRIKPAGTKSRPVLAPVELRDGYKQTVVKAPNIDLAAKRVKSMYVAMGRKDVKVIVGHPNQWGHMVVVNFTRNGNIYSHHLTVHK